MRRTVWNKKPFLLMPLTYAAKNCHKPTSCLQAAQHSRAAPMGARRQPCSPPGRPAASPWHTGTELHQVLWPVHTSFQNRLFLRPPHWARLLQLIMAAVIWKQCTLFLFCFFRCHIAIVERFSQLTCLDASGFLQKVLHSFVSTQIFI